MSLLKDFLGLACQCKHSKKKHRNGKCALCSCAGFVAKPTNQAEPPLTLG
jgi:hypothetical protein